MRYGLLDAPAVENRTLDRLRPPAKTTFHLPGRAGPQAPLTVPGTRSGRICTRYTVQVPVPFPQIRI